MTKVIERSKGVLETDFPSGKVLFHTFSRRPYILNKTASAFWDYCKASKDIESVVRYLSKEYAISPVRAGRDVEVLISDMREKRLIRLYERKDRV